MKVEFEIPEDFELRVLYAPHKGDHKHDSRALPVWCAWGVMADKNQPYIIGSTMGQGKTAQEAIDDAAAKHRQLQRTKPLKSSTEINLDLSFFNKM